MMLLERSKFRASFRGVDRHADTLHGGCCDDQPAYEADVEIFAKDIKHAKEILEKEFLCRCTGGTEDAKAESKCLRFEMKNVMWREVGLDEARRTGAVIIMLKFLGYQE